MAQAWPLGRCVLIADESISMATDGGCTPIPLPEIRMLLVPYLVTIGSPGSGEAVLTADGDILTADGEEITWQ